MKPSEIKRCHPGAFSLFIVYGYEPILLLSLGKKSTLYFHEYHNVDFPGLRNYGIQITHRAQNINMNVLWSYDSDNYRRLERYNVPFGLPV